MSIIINRVWRKVPITEQFLIGQEVKRINLKPVKQITARFDPFGDKVKSTRSFLIAATSYKCVKTNQNIKFKTDIVCDRSKPEVTFELLSGEKILLQTENLSLLEILQLYNKHITDNIPKEEPVVLKSKSLQKRRKR